MSGPFHHCTKANRVAKAKMTRTISNMAFTTVGESKEVGEARQRPADEPRRRKEVLAARLSGGCVSDCGPVGRRSDRYSAVTIMERTDAMRTAAARILAGRQRREVPVEPVLTASSGHEPAPANGARNRPAHVARRKESCDRRVAHARRLGTPLSGVSGGGVSLR
jgi:hypothetical protein